MCKFCEAIESNKKCEKIIQGRATDAELAEYGRWMTEYAVAIVKRSWYEKKGKKSAGRTIQYRRNGMGFALNFCQECGRKLK